ncbi:MAG: DJ-1/PfpI family protein, partial [Erysipelotrichaceae bacterium]|nr:DJ-1/PfpI family protein [Erysipelotrichaceae bacterium]
MKTMIIVNDGLEECEALITYDLLYRAGIEVELVGFTKEITSSHKVVFKADKLLDEIDPSEYECLILPGGMPGTLNLENDERVQKLIDQFIKEDKYVCAICAAPSI